MKRVIIILLASMLLSACGSKVHKNIDKDMAENTRQIADTIDEAIKDDRDLTEREIKMLDDYQLLYGAKHKDEQLTKEENQLWLITRNMLDIHDRSGMLSSDLDFFESETKTIRKIIKTGER